MLVCFEFAAEVLAELDLEADSSRRSGVHHCTSSRTRVKQLSCAIDSYVSACERLPPNRMAPENAWTDYGMA